MHNDEVIRLRKLRISALRVRAIARGLEGSHTQPATRNRMQRIAGAAWRLSRAISGHLRAHPYATFQQDVGKLTLLANALRASVVAHQARRCGRAADGYIATDLSRLERSVNDARALTCTMALSDSLGRSQAEIRALLADLHSRERAAPRALTLHPSMPTDDTASVTGPDLDWPYLTF